ncbi:ATP-binding cassette sub-family C member 1 [Operophtera brumata]|uniref:ATP-binding cassette sub-family C member 1 n=1 Tax=Operophtera brumata TaxID=104452 RepID=A0A0L7LR74_OPEBR|nr:ATP-binding cassette sub-family C member 1 [Operophtera brumata]
MSYDYNSTLDEFCGSKFWNTTLSWHTNNPELTECFQKTVLVWVPCAYLWLAAFLDAYYILNSKEKNIPWNPLNITKLIVTCLLIVLKFVDLGVTVHKASADENDVFNADYFSPILKIATFALSATLLFYNRKFGLRASGVLFFFWFFLIIAGLSQLRTEIVKHANLPDDENVRYSFVSYMVYYPLIILMFVLNCFADLPPRDTPYKHEKNPCPERASGFPSRLTFSWFDPLALTGFRRGLTEKDLWSLNPQDASLEVVQRFDKIWERSLRKRELSNGTQATYRKTSASVNFKPDEEKKPASILPALCLAFGGQFLFGALLKLINDCLMFLSPQLLKFIELMAYLNMIWSAPLQIALALYFLWGILGPSVLAGLAVMIILIPVNGLIASRVKTLQIRQMKYKDERVKLMNEVLNGIKVLKMYAWEPSFEDQILKIRNKEMNVTFLTFFTFVISDPENNILTATNIFVSMSLFYTMHLPLGLLPLIIVSAIEVSLMSFGCFVLVNDTEVLDSKRAFVALSLFNILRFPLSMLPNVISNVVQTSVGINRLNKFMNCDELDVSSVEHDRKERTIAYVPQQAWIQNATLQDNILFGKDLDNNKYNNVINVCALKTDFDVLPGGLLKSKTRVWVTHNVSYLSQTDLVVVLKDGEMSEAGTYQQLLEKKGAFAEFLLHHLSDAERTSPEELDEIKQDLESKLGSEFQNKLQRARSLSERDRSGSVKRKTPEVLTPNELKEQNKLIETEKTETGSRIQTLPDERRHPGIRGDCAHESHTAIASVSVSSLALYLGTLAAARALHAGLLSGVLHAPSIGFFDCTPVGRVLNRFSKDVDVVDNVLPMTLRGWTSCFFSTSFHGWSPKASSAFFQLFPRYSLI